MDTLKTLEDAGDGSNPEMNKEAFQGEQCSKGIELEFLPGPRDSWDFEVMRDAGTPEYERKGFFSQIKGIIHDAPQIIDLRQYCHQAEMELPGKFDPGGDGALLAVQVSFHVEASGLPYVNAVGLELRFRDDDEGLNRRVACRVLGYLPEPQYSALAQAETGGVVGLRFGDVPTLQKKIFETTTLERPDDWRPLATIGKATDAKAADSKTSATDSGAAKERGDNVSGDSSSQKHASAVDSPKPSNADQKATHTAGLQEISLNGTPLVMGAAASLKGSLLLSIEWKRKIVEAWGRNSWGVRWRFFKDKEPLINREFSPWCILLFDKNFDSIEFEARLLLDVWEGIVPATVETKWRKFEVDVERVTSASS